MTRYIVVRDPDQPSIDGWWYDYDVFPSSPPKQRISLYAATYSPTGEWETRDDGARAEVYRRKRGRS